MWKAFYVRGILVDNWEDAGECCTRRWIGGCSHAKDGWVGG